MIETLSAYTQEFDPRAYQGIKEGPVEDYQERKDNLDAYTTRQLQTLLAERYKVLLNGFRYQIKNEQFYGQNMDEPALNSFIRGRDYRREKGSGLDFAREDAEIEGFTKIQDFLASTETPVGAMMLSISLKGGEGSSYQHNFYDVFTRKEDHVEARRYTSALTPQDYIKRLGIEVPATDVYFLSNPINVTGFGTPDEVHAFLHEEHEYMDVEVFREKILIEVAPFIANYIRACAQDGELAQRLAFNAILNVADEVKKRIRSEAYGIYEDKIHFSASAVISYGMREVEVVLGGCGNVEGFTMERAIFDVSDFDPASNDQYGTLNVYCEACGATSRRERGKLLEKCSNGACSDPTYIACKPN